MTIINSSRKNSRLPKGQRIYAIGDIHGRVDLLCELYNKIIDDQENREISQIRLVFLGDYIDRGPNSKDVIDVLLDAANPYEKTFLKGNHEALFLDFFAYPQNGIVWLKNGGLETLASYGVPEKIIKAGATFKYNALTALRDALTVVFTAEHLAFFQGLELSYVCGQYFFVHGGVKPGVPLDQQQEEDMLWIRDEFLQFKRSFGATIVHGHTPVLMPDDLKNRIGIDTYAYHTGCLTAVGLEEKKRWFLSTG